MSATITTRQTLDVLECGVCAVSFAMPRSLREHAEESGDFFWCPNGHKIHYCETENQRLRNQLENARNNAARQSARADQAEASAAAHKGHATRLKKRAQAGVCPCCHRSFKQLRRHMASQHPEFDAEADE